VSITGPGKVANAACSIATPLAIKEKHVDSGRRHLFDTENLLLRYFTCRRPAVVTALDHRLELREVDRGSKTRLVGYALFFR
jgi:hypothetical protein